MNTDERRQIENETGRRVYYNEIDADLCRWLRNLIAAGLIPRGDVDERSITDVKPTDLDGYDQCHFFCGVAGWPLALQLAGWPDGRPVWTGSCPCQPFSAAGKRRAGDDPRHLWPAWLRIVAECRPPVLFGEQVASGLGREWLAGVRADLEALGYAVGAADLCAAGVGAPHIRQRLFWVAAAADDGCSAAKDRRDARQSDDYGWVLEPAGVRASRRLDNAPEPRPQGRDTELLQAGQAEGRQPGRSGDARGMADHQCHGLQRAESTPGAATDRRQRPAQHGDAGGMGDTESRRAEPTEQSGRVLCLEQAGPWGDFRIIPCADGKHRRIGAESGDEPLADGVPAKLADLLPRLGELADDPEAAAAMAREARRARRVMLKAWGNAINPYVAAVFVKAWLNTGGGKWV